MAGTHGGSGVDGWTTDLLGRIASLAVIGAALGVVAALLLGGHPGAWSAAEDAPTATECGMGLLRLGGR